MSIVVSIDGELVAPEAAKVSVGDKLEMAVQPTTSAVSLAKALEQSKVTTQPKTPRSDAIHS